MTSENKIFYRRRLPHYQPPGATFHITFRLAGSLPQSVLAEFMEEQTRLEHEAVLPANESQMKVLQHEAKEGYFIRFDETLNKAEHGPKWLQEQDVAAIVADAIHSRDNKECELIAFSIMPNHVHLITTVKQINTSLNRFLQSLKAYTGRECNGILGRSGAFWQHESYDHVIRDGIELEQTIWYVLENPATAGLCKNWRDWKWTYIKEGLIDW